MKVPSAGAQNVMLKRLASIALVGLLFACGTSKSTVKEDPGSTEGEPIAENVRQGQKGDEKVVEYDLNRDKKPDVWSYSVKAKSDDGKDFDKLVRKELDINWDGKVDITREYGDKEQIAREVLDLDFDGKVDQTNYYEKGIIVRKERDLDYNSRPDLWIFYEKGKITRKERDTNSDGKIDYWEYWEGDQVDRIGEDLDGDGNVDKWTKNPNSES